MYKNASGYTYEDYVAIQATAPYMPLVDKAYWTASSRLTDLFVQESSAIRGDVDSEALTPDELAEKQELIEYISGRREYFESLFAKPEHVVEYSDHETRSMYRQVPGGAPGEMEKNPDYGVRALNGLFPIVR